MKNNSLKTIYTTVSIDKETSSLVEKICKRYSLKKGEVVKLAFQYLDKGSINPSEAPESTKAELRKINKRQDDLFNAKVLTNTEKPFQNFRQWLLNENYVEKIYNLSIFRKILEVNYLLPQ